MPYTPQQNGRSEPVNQTLMNIVICLLIESGLAAKCNLKNLCPTSALKGDIPFELWSGGNFGEKDFKWLRVFGRLVWYTYFATHTTHTSLCEILPALSLTYEQQRKPIELYGDADWGGDTSNRKSYSGLVIKLARGAVPWSSRKQNCVANSMAESDVLQELELSELIGEPFKVHMDNQGAISLANNRMTSRRSKHVDIKYNFVGDKVERGEVCLSYIKSQGNPADLITKPLTGRKIKNFSEMK
ncbi:hypothetical protein PR048_012764 [Dryococelus australis]|uniref:Integrase catalytic domain-containing protein n=1 Tax=Dryococelus australis TaxID=614101 RepID=A0ABQ9HRR1_9NEOP|nr:hypothetical protein PR048_012764 [Dryococelus australis]